jgi:hypothetical protein
MADKKRFAKGVTPKGVLVHPWVNKPDTKFKTQGEYKATLLLEPSDERDALVAMLEAELERTYEEQCAELARDPKNKNKKVKRCEDAQWGDYVDEDGNETDMMFFKFKLTASGVRKDGTTWTMKTKLFDRYNKPLDAEVQVWGGSTGKISFEMVPWYQAKFGHGLKLSLSAVKLIDIVEGGGGNAGSYGFDDDEEAGEAEAGADRDERGDDDAEKDF